MNKKTEVNEELKNREKTFKTFRRIMIVIDILALAILIIQIKLKDVAYYSYVLLVFCNIITFVVRPSDNMKADGNIKTGSKKKRN